LQSHFLYTGTDPDHVQSDWSDNTQGLAQDDFHWYIAPKGRLWRVTVNTDLRFLSLNTNTALHVLLADIPELAADGYNHLGDIVYHEDHGQAYLIVPIEALPDRAGLAVFSAPSLSYIDHIELFPGPDTRQGHWAWVAVDPEGRLYSSDFDNVDRIIQYPVDWAALNASREFLVSNADAVEIPLRDENGEPITLDAVQGGEFAPGGKMLYLVNGLPGCPAGPDPVFGSIHAFEAPSFRRVA